MNRTFRFSASRIFGSLAFGTTLLATGVARAAPQTPSPAAPAATPPAESETDAATLISKLRSMLGRPGGLTSAVVATRAEATSYDVLSKKEDIEAAAAQVDQALVAYFPRLTATGRYMRLSPIDPPVVGYTVVAPGIGPGPIPPGTPLFNAPFAFPILLNQTILQANLNVPLSDYLLRIPQAHAAATKNQKAAIFAESATRLKSRDRCQGRLLHVGAGQAPGGGHRAGAFAIQGAPRRCAARFRSRDDLESGRDAGGVAGGAGQASPRARQEHGRNHRNPDPRRHARHRAHGLRSRRIDGRRAVPRRKARRAWPPFSPKPAARALELKALEQTSDALREQAKVARAGNYPKLDVFGDIIYANPNQRVFPLKPVFRSDVGRRRAAQLFAQ